MAQTNKIRRGRFVRIRLSVTWWRPDTVPDNETDRPGQQAEQNDSKRPSASPLRVAPDPHQAHYDECRDHGHCDYRKQLVHGMCPEVWLQDIYAIRCVLMCLQCLEIKRVRPPVSDNAHSTALHNATRKDVP